jgi:hypothetical protein
MDGLIVEEVASIGRGIMLKKARNYQESFLVCRMNTVCDEQPVL